VNAARVESTSECTAAIVSPYWLARSRFLVTMVGFALRHTILWFGVLFVVPFTSIGEYLVPV